jgi:signal transduction histidine kinase
VELKFSIRYKILGVVTVLLVSAISLYLLIAAKIFKQDKTELVFELNKSVVATLSTEVETALRGSADKLKLYAMLFSALKNNSSQEAFNEVIKHDSMIVRLELFEMGSAKKMNLLTKITEPTFSKLYGLNDHFFEEELVQKRAIPFDKIQSRSLHVWNSTIKGGPALIGMGLSVIKETDRGIPEKVLAVVAYLKADLFMQNIKSSRISQSFILDSEGRVLVHQNSQLMLENYDYSQSRIVKELHSGRFANGVMEFKEGDNEELGAYARTNISGIGVVSQVDKKIAFAAVQNLITRSFLFALIVITTTFIATIFFSRTLTRPLHRLLEAMEKVAHGELDTEVAIKSGDEISILAGSFNQMTKDLKQSRGSLEKINRELESKVLDRTRKLEEQNRAVKEAQEALLRTTRLASVGEIAGRAAHEVLNPLTSMMARVSKIQKRLNEEIVGQKNLITEIIGAWNKESSALGEVKFLETLKSASSLNPQVTLLHEDLSNINEVLKNWDADLSTLDGDTKFLLSQASRIEKILGQMRSLSVVSTVKNNLKASHIIHEAVNIVADLFSKNHVELIEEYHQGLDDIYVDKDELIQVLTNLLRNSLQAVCENTKEKALRLVKIKTQVEFDNARSKSHLIIEISDTGVGIINDNIPKLFKTQFTTKAKDQGTGLGLSISRRFVRGFNGELYLASSIPYKLTVFRIELPLTPSQNEVAA